MNRSISVLAVLLLASLLGNLLLAVRISRLSDAPTASKGPTLAAERVTSSEDLKALQHSLETERKKNEDLQSRIDRLEIDKKVLAAETPMVPGRSEKLAAFKEKLRKLKKMMADPAFKEGNGANPDAMVELTETMMEFMRLSALRAKEPKTYSDYLRTFYEVVLEGDGTSLTADQQAQLNTLLQGYGEDLSRIPPEPAGNRLLQQIQLEGATLGRLQTLFSEAQKSAMAKENMQAMAFSDMLSISYIGKEGAAAQIAQQWTSQYQLDASQNQQAKLAAQSYVDAMARIRGQFNNSDPSIATPGSPEAYEYRVQSIREQLAALSLLQASMTPAQTDRLRTQTMKELHIVDIAGQAEVVTTPDK
jgi:hypothetical protein